MATVVVPRPQPTPPPPLSAPILTLNTSSKAVPVVPNKHLPICSPGSPPTLTPETPPASPPKYQNIQPSLLHPPTRYPLRCKSPPVYSIDSSALSAALHHNASQPLPDPKLVFPWLHGLSPDNHLQLAFFVARRKALRKTPNCLRNIAIVKFGGDLSCSKLKGALSPDELIDTRSSRPVFLEVDPRDGFSVRNFQIQAAKLATLSDIVVYGDHTARPNQVLELAKSIAKAQGTYRNVCDPGAKDLMNFNTFVLSSPFREIERSYPDLVAISSVGEMTGSVMDFFHWERIEMCHMSKASEISPNVWLGPTPETAVVIPSSSQEESRLYDVLIEAVELAQAPDKPSLARFRAALEESEEPQYISFPPSGSIVPPTWTKSELEGILNMCRWIYEITHQEAEDSFTEEKDCDGDSTMACRMPSPRRVLIHCTDGYTESSLLALAYYVYAEGVPVHEAWLQLHRDKGRNFFAYPSDVTLLTALEARLLELSPKRPDINPFRPDPAWLSKMDGSLPSRILPYMYLGNLSHANNPEMLRAVGISRILSVGEPVTWTVQERREWGSDDVLSIDRVQDNGVDPLTNDFERCLEFIERGKRDGKATLVHCRVGVSRSATICIAEVMNSTGMSFPRAYCFVRARRLNVIIQPHLRFSYELLKWEEHQQNRRGLPVQRELEWATIAREIALMNRPYSR
ncbi:MAG: tyrosine/serine/threonine protein phosphatase pps1 [Vezdaea aestivalis]|nr:MAG: tyrosine/serine/threonine protein phosphatase pps1 [Vezdaea aestivalis]